MSECAVTPLLLVLVTAIAVFTWLHFHRSQPCLIGILRLITSWPASAPQHNRRYR